MAHIVRMTVISGVCIAVEAGIKLDVDRAWALLYFFISCLLGVSALSSLGF